jgi:hypothetical protein
MATRRPSLTAAARGVLPKVGRDEETVAFGRTKKLTEGREFSAIRRLMFSCVQSAPCGCHAVPRATTVLAKMTSFLAQATSATLCSFPAAMSRWYIAMSCGL